VDRALEYTERGRARVLLDRMAAGGVDLRAGIEPAERAKLEAWERHAGARTAELQRRLTVLGARNDLSEGERARGARALSDSLGIAEGDLADVIEAWRATSPLWRGVLTAAGRPLTLDTIRARLVPPGRAMLLYQIGDERSVVFVIAPDGAGRAARVEAVPLVVDTAEARALGVAPGVLTAGALAHATGPTAPNAPNTPNTSLAALLGRAPYDRGAGEGDAMLRRLAALRRVLVPDAVWARVAHARELLVVPDRGLYT